MSKYKSINRHKFLLQYHLIFVCKYRKNFFLNQNVSSDIKILSREICDRYNIIFKHIETDKNHIH